MPTLEQIQAKIAKLQSQAEAIAAKQATAVLKEIASLMAANGIGTRDIDSFLATKKTRSSPAGKAASKSAVKVATKKRGRPARSAAEFVAKGKMPAKYLNPKTGETWSGHARPPAWIKDAKDRTKFLIDGVDGTTKPAVAAKKLALKKVSAKKAVTKRAFTKTAGVRARKKHSTALSTAVTEMVAD